MDGKYFFDHLLVPRAYRVSDIWSRLGPYLYFVQMPFVVAIIWACRASRWFLTGHIWAVPDCDPVAVVRNAGAGSVAPDAGPPA